VGPVEQLSFRADYSYSWLTDYIEIENGRYVNNAELGISSAEFLADLRFNAGHWLTLGYTFLDISEDEKGKLRSVPNQWFSIQAAFNLWKRKLMLGTNLLLLGSHENYNKAPPFDEEGTSIRTGHVNEDGEPVAVPAYEVLPSDVIVERIPPAALWNLKLFYRLPDYGLRFDFDVYNLLNATAYYPDPHMNQAAYVADMPIDQPGMSYFLSVRYTL
jgi:outer membrane receptor protein involved in Fe transport